jgi:hypothetical protein
VIGRGSLADRAAAALDKAKGDLDRIDADIAAHASGKPDGTDLDALVDWRRKGRDLADQREAGEEVLAAAHAAAERQAKIAAEAEKDRRHAAAQKLATAHAKLTLDIVADAERLAAKLVDAERMRKEIDAANEAREGRPFIVDGEQRVREIPKHTISASTREEVVWLNSRGEQPNQLRKNQQGESVPWETGYGPTGPFTLTRRQVVQSPERVEPARMPARLAAAIRLVDLKGERLWPHA